MAIIHRYEPEWPENDIPLGVFKGIMSKDKVEQLAIAGAFIGASIDYININKLPQPTDSKVNQIITLESEMEALADLFARTS